MAEQLSLCASQLIHALQARENKPSMSCRCLRLLRCFSAAETSGAMLRARTAISSAAAAARRSGWHGASQACDEAPAQVRLLDVEPRSLPCMPDACACHGCGMGSCSFSKCCLRIQTAHAPTGVGAWSDISPSLDVVQVYLMAGSPG